MTFPWLERRRERRRIEVGMLDETAQPSTFIEQGCELSGEMRFRDSVRIEGRAEGEIRAGGLVIVGESAEIQASVRAEAVIVHGSVDGDIRAKRKITLHKTARVAGELQSAGIVIEEGARFKGCIVIGEDEPSTPQPMQLPGQGASGAAGSSSAISASGVVGD
jgi:cytoskeletal protein CcmA (bactofilin family)